MEFSTLPLIDELQEVLAEIGFAEATPIQAQALPALLEGRDLIGQSATGSGKTLAFSLPLLQSLDPERRLQALVLSPTRELSQQVAREIRRLGRKMPGLQVLLLTGGQPLRPQSEALAKGVHVAVGTPGRVLDHLRRGGLDLSALTYLVLDEADRMLDMGFADDMAEVLDACPPDRQTALFSATFPDRIEEMSEAWQRDPVRVTIESAGAEAPDIEQWAVVSEDKLSALRVILATEQPAACVVFCNLKATVAELHESLPGSACLHGDLEQSDRDRILAKFRNGSARVLVATDVAARGLDVQGLDLVVNFDLPKSDVYVHRVGRTGRAGKAGKAVSLATSQEKYKLKHLSQDLGLQLEVRALDLSADKYEDSDTAPADLAASAMATLFIGGGRKEKVRPGDILGALTGEAGGFQGTQIGKIEIHDHFAYVAVESRISEAALVRLREGKIKGRKFRVEKVR